MTKISMSLNGYLECRDGFFRKVVEILSAKSGKAAATVHERVILVRDQAGKRLKSEGTPRNFDIDAWKLSNCKVYAT